MRALRLAPIIKTHSYQTIYNKRPASEFSVKVREFDRSHSSLESLVSGLRSGPVYRLFEIVCGHNSESYGEVCFKRNLGDPFEDFRRDVLVVGSLAANDDAEANHCIVLVTKRGALGRHRQFERTRNADDGDRVA